jgi:acetolactate synthase-1/2/3 large subunit
MAKYKTGEAFIELLNARGVEKVFINPGAESVGILTEVASARVEGKKSPQLVLCLDESVAAAAAYGSYMVSGKPQVVVVHSEIGSLQLGGNLQNLQWGRIPAVILAAYNETETQRTMWNGQPFDQGGIVRNSVKYDRKLSGGEDFHEALTDAFNIACTEPTGPVYLCFPMDYLYREIEKPETLPAAKETVSLPAADMEKLGEMADILLNAENPLLVSGNAGRYHGNVGALVSLAETLCASALTGYSWMNFPGNHPLCVGIEQIGGSRKMDAGYEDADVILAIDYAMPYVASAPLPNPETMILHIDIDPLTQGRKLWGRGADIFMKADAREAIPALEKLLKDRMTAEKKAELEERFRRIAARNEEARKGWYAAAQDRPDHEPVCPDHLCYCLNQLIDEDTIVINHTLSQCASVTEQIVRTKPGTWFGCPSGAIGWAPGAALGAAAAAPGKTVVAVMTDGGFVWGCPTSTLWTAANYRFPFLAIICNNKGYGAVRGIQLDQLKGGYPSEQFIAESAVDFMPDYAVISQGAGAFGRTVTKAGEVMPALKEALAAVRGGKPAVLDVHFTREPPDGGSGQ